MTMVLDSAVGKNDIKIEKKGHILLIAWNRPEKYNALTLNMYHQLAKAYYQLQNDDELRVAVVYGEGKHFTSGLQLDDWTQVFSQGRLPELAQDELDPYGLSGEVLRKPVIMAVQGLCYTAGIELLLNSDIRIAADNTRFAQLEVQRGFHACGGATIRLPLEVGWGNAQRYLLTGDEWSAEQALNWGMVQQVVPASDVLATALDVAEKVCKAAPLGVQGSLMSSKYVRLQQEETAKARLFKDLMPVMKSKDMQEGLMSFLERRDAVFTGS
jgi:enoyl-CoA hydratase/carnithine racemase